MDCLIESTHILPLLTTCLISLNAFTAHFSDSCPNSSNFIKPQVLRYLLTSSWLIQKNLDREFLQDDIFSSGLEHIICSSSSHVCADTSPTSAETSSMGHSLKQSYTRNCEFLCRPRQDQQVLTISP